MTGGAVLFGLFRIIKALGVVSGNAAQQERVVMVLSAQKLLVLVQLAGNTDLVAGGTKFRALVQRLKEGALVKFGFGFDQLIVDGLENSIRAERERIMDGFINGIVRISASAIDVSDGMARGAGDAGLRGWMFLEVVIRVIERAAEERNDIVTARAPA